uniref:C2H2-type domain-containing protein n=1 Tax=Trichogramma kaykai TaxID=54128 RepID=A0ABD2VVK4_9HYME
MQHATPRVKLCHRCCRYCSSTFKREKRLSPLTLFSHQRNDADEANARRETLPARLNASICQGNKASRRRGAKQQKAVAVAPPGGTNVPIYALYMCKITCTSDDDVHARFHGQKYSSSSTFASVNIRTRKSKSKEYIETETDTDDDNKYSQETLANNKQGLHDNHNNTTQQNTTNDSDKIMETLTNQQF